MSRERISTSAAAGECEAAENDFERRSRSRASLRRTETYASVATLPAALLKAVLSSLLCD